MNDGQPSGQHQQRQEAPVHWTAFKLLKDPTIKSHNGPPFKVYRYDGSLVVPEGVIPGQNTVQSVRDPRRPRFGFETALDDESRDLGQGRNFG